MKTFGNLNKRQAGILLAMSSLPGNHGIGDMGACAYEFIDISHKMGFKIWQMLPLNPSSDGDSPYSPYSSYAGDEIYISLDRLVEWQLLKPVKTYLKDAMNVDYKRVRKFKRKQLLKAFQTFKAKNSFKEEYDAFVKEAAWLDDYSNFMALNKANQGKPWLKWPANDQKLEARGDIEDIDYHKFIQFIFIKQFKELKEYAHRQGMILMGDLPIYVGHDSADVYNNRNCFMLDKNNQPLYISGASPDYFSEDGQLWNHPLYNWDYLKKDNYRYWVDKLKWNNAMFDVLRIDHFRAFDTYWQVPFGEKTARNGKWIEGPSYNFFDAVLKQIPDLNIIVEDLGELRPEVHKLRDHYNLMGMRIIQYSFGPNEAKEGYRIPEHCIAYSGTHDNDPLKGWYHDLGKQGQKEIKGIIRRWNYPESKAYQRVLHRTFACEAKVAICQVQDILDYDSKFRLNLPGTEGEPNWCFKLANLTAYRKKISRVNKLLKACNRI